MNIRTRLKQAKMVLLTDSEVRLKDITGVLSLSDIKDIMNIQRDGRLIKAHSYSGVVIYKLSNSDYTFKLTILN